MIFDFYLSVNLVPGLSHGIEHIKFKNEPLYKDIKGTEESIILKNGYSTCLYRQGFSESFHQKKDLKLWVFGSVFTNKKYSESKSRTPWKLNAGEILDLYLHDNNTFVHLIKGSYVLVLLDESNNTVKVITDRLNVLPLYYFFKDQMLILSSNVRMILHSGFVSKELDPQALTEQLLFDYMLRDHYFYKDLRQTENARIYTFSKERLRNEAYWSVEELYHEKLLPCRVSLEMLSEQLFENVNLYSSDREKVLVSFTGGFDGRTNVAMIRKPVSDFLCYSYGMPGSKQITIPEGISKKLNLQYQPVYLDEEFERDYQKYAEEAIEFSNGTAPIIRANYPFVYKQLQNYSDLIITGLFGSEILRPLHNLGIMINDFSEDIFLNYDYANAIKESLEKVNGKNYMDAHLVSACADKIIQSFKEDYFDRYSKYDKVTRFFFFILQEGIRKYFMQEIQIERVYVTTRFPYLDDDLVELIYQTTFAGMYNGFLGKSKVKRRKGQLLYAYIIKKYKPELGKLMLDRGYASNDLLKPFPFNYLVLASGVLKAKQHIKKYGNDTFNSEKWTQKTIECFLSNKTPSNLFSEGINKKFEDKSYLSDLLTYSHLVSLMEFLK